MTAVRREDRTRRNAADPDPDRVQAALDLLAASSPGLVRDQLTDRRAQATTDLYLDLGRAVRSAGLPVARDLRTLPPRPLRPEWMRPSSTESAAGPPKGAVEDAVVLDRWAAPASAERIVAPVDGAGVPHRLLAVGPPAPVRPVVDPAGVSPTNIRKARAALWVRNAGLVVLLFLAYQLWGTGLEQHRAQMGLAAAFAKVDTAASTRGGNTTLPTTAGGSNHVVPVAGPAAVVPVLPGGVVGRLQIPAIHLDQYVVEGTGEEDLKRGPGHYTGSATLGHPGNVAIAGHRTTYGAPFNKLADLKPGDTILATTREGRFLYVVAEEFTVAPSQTSVVDDYGDSRLTLTTCTPEFSATRRLVAVASLQGPAPAVTPERAPPPPTVASRPITTTGAASTALRRAAARSFDVSAMPVLVVDLGVLVMLAMAYRPLRRRVPPIASLMLLVPLWTAVLLLCFEQANRFLPPNV